MHTLSALSPAIDRGTPHVHVPVSLDVWNVSFRRKDSCFRGDRGGLYTHLSYLAVVNGLAGTVSFISSVSFAIYYC